MRFVLCLAVSLALFLVPAVSVSAQPVPTLTPVWETDTLLTTVESAIYDPETNLIYTTNIDGHFMDKDGQGSISTVTTDGQIQDARWITGLNAPTGTGIWEGHLFVTDLDAIVEIDIAAGAVVQRHAIEGAVALNDLAIDDEGTVFASDTGGNTIYALRDGTIEAVASGIETPNGLHPEAGRLLITRWTPRSVDWLNLSDQTLEPVAEGIPGPDGLEPVGDGRYLASGFNGLVYLIEAGREKTLLLDTTEEGQRAADIEYIQTLNLLVVPTMQRNTLAAYRLNWDAGD
ncbi:MAG: ATP-binding protein [Bacteroidota bacterium]